MTILNGLKNMMFKPNFINFKKDIHSPHDIRMLDF
jgi:hypothetical protein